MDKKPKKRRSRRKKKILSPHSLQDLADADRELIASSTRRTISAISDLNEMSALTPHSSSNFLVGDGNIFQETDGVKVNNKSADSDLQKFSKSKAQHVPLESPPQQTRTRLPTLNTQMEVGKSAEKIVDKGLRTQYKESMFALAHEKSEKPRQQLHHESVFRPSTSSGQFDYWRGNVHNMNYSNMRNLHSNRQKEETEKARKQIRARSGKSFGILTLTNTTQWAPKKAFLLAPFKQTKKSKVRAITCFNCGKKGHKAAECPELKSSQK